jgi:hypothetical protein
MYPMTNIDYRKLLSTLTFVSFAFFLQAQADFSGHWTGVITQDEGGYKSEYRFELFLNQNGTRVYGRSYVFDEGLYAVMELRGTIYNNDYLRFQETKMVDFTVVENMEWCIKRGDIVLKSGFRKEYITGLWKGVSSMGDCVPGQIKLEREAAQAAID